MGMFRVRAIRPEGLERHPDDPFINMKTGRKRILVVDDEPQMTMVLQLLFQRDTDYEVRVENDPTRALAAAVQFQPNLILLDVNMPKLDGGELASRISQCDRLSKVPVVFLTGNITREEVSARRGMSGGLPFVAKPVDMPELLGRVREYLAPKI